jgi:uncharacterized protein
VTQTSPSFDGAAIDAAVFPQLVHPDELRDFMSEPWKSRSLPPPHSYHFTPPAEEYYRAAWPAVGVPGSDPELLSADVFAEGGADYAILVPLTRGLLPDVDLANAVCRGTNEWLAQSWLDAWNSDGRFRGSIRVNPDDPGQAVREIEHWADHPYMVQVAVPLESQHPYGKRAYLPIWEAAARHNLPVYFHTEGGSGIEFPPTPVGYCRYYAEYRVLSPLNMFYHLSSLIAEGVFDRLPQFRVVFGDGGADIVMPLMWRMDMTWRSTRMEMPRARGLPTSYLCDHVRFGTQALEGPEDETARATWYAANDAAAFQVFGSHYPFWSFASRRQTEMLLPEAYRHRVMSANASVLYALGVDSDQ